MSLLDSMKEQISASNRMLGTKDELVDYFRAKYPSRGSGSWRKQIVGRLAQNTGMKAKNLERRFDPSRLNNVPRTKRERDQYKELGEQIGPVPPKNGYSVTWHGEIRISNVCWPRAFGPMLIAGEDAERLAATGDVFIIFRVYFQGQDLADGWCGSPSITIEPASDGQTQMKFAHPPQPKGSGSRFAAAFKR